VLFTDIVSTYIVPKWNPRLGSDSGGLSFLKNMAMRGSFV
jgi:hypothetical protein